MDLLGYLSLRFGERAQQGSADGVTTSRIGACLSDGWAELAVEQAERTTPALRRSARGRIRTAPKR